MIQFLCVNKISQVNGPGSLPGEMHSISEFANSTKFTPQDRIKMLASQAFLANYVSGMCESHCPSMNEYREQLQRLFATCIPQKCDSMDASLYERYRSVLSDILEDKVSDLNGIRMLFDDCITCNPSVNQLPRGFYEPLLQVLSKGHKRRGFYSGAILLVPYLQKCSGGHSVVFVPKTFATCDLEATSDFSVNPSLEFFHRLDWTGSNWIGFTGTLQNFFIEPRIGFDSFKSMAGTLRAITHRSAHPSMVKSGVRNLFVRSLKTLETRYRIRMDAFESLGFILSGFGYESTGFLTTAIPSNKDVAGFEQYAELAFIKPHKLQAAMEADEQDKDEDDPEETQDESTADSDADKDPLEDDPETDPDTEGDDAEDPGDGTDDSAGDDLGGDDLGMGDDESSDSSGSGDVAPQLTDTVKEPEDPLAIVFRIVNAETFSDYLFRKSANAALSALIESPPPNMSSETVAFLKMWFTDWIDIVDTDTTRSVLRQFAVEIDV
jgi:hypothetical protein